jgi:hypothetical protein
MSGTRILMEAEAGKGAEFAGEGKHGALGFVELAFPNAEFQGVYDRRLEFSFREAEAEGGGRRGGRWTQK